MSKKLYLQFLFLVAVICYAGNVSAENHNLIPSSGQKVYVPITAKSAKGKLLITNYGSTTIRDFDYTLSFNGEDLVSKNYVLLKPLNRMEGATIEVDVPPHTQVSETDLLFRITKVNGEVNGASVNQATLPRVTATRIPHRRVVVEEYTAMWCGYCPRGIALMENLAKNYPDDFIGIAVHTGGRADPLSCLDYAWKAADYRSRPTLHMNRNLLLGYVKAITEFEEERSRGADMDIDVTATWDARQENITVTPRVTFCVDKEDVTYGFAYVLTEDGMSSPEWYQNNYYSGRTEELGVSDELDYFIKADYTVKGLENNFVAIAAEGVKAPLTGYIQTPIKADEAQSHTYVFRNISSKKLIQDKAKLKVCVLLINIKTGQIENAAKCTISPANTTAISSVSEGKETVVETARYTLDGRRVTTPQKGINIVKYSDGRVCKEVVTR
ncbi:thioredoxin family protein [Prevotella fusca]